MSQPLDLRRCACRDTTNQVCDLCQGPKGKDVQPGDQDSERRRQIINAIVGLTEAEGYAPTIRELALEVGVSSPDTIAYHLAKLRDDGRVTWADGKSRTLRVVTR